MLIFTHFKPHTRIWISAFIIANGAAACDHEVTIFFTFWGLNAQRKDLLVPVKNGLLERVFTWLMPRGLKQEELLDGIEYAGVVA
ncbi:DsrE/DsrF/DrsH-like family protein [Paenibacillus sp. L3-i20]|uniref:DsrE/DsrF/DrsH-like family protein n=1 Tax=Paenibacillus sp. L3-i20 TaxID=2905833 RepID=UPI001EDE64D3|nr:DsrE/DsrF/DrsH-like family protein [Paenibacillus sp. L3-i20]